MSVSWSDGKRQPPPESWARGEEGLLCLKCRRNAAEAGVEPTTGKDGEPVDRRRKANLIEFEIRRAPGRRDNEIARACNSSTAAVSKVRKQIECSTPRRG
jgi:hypothetical protein